MNRLDKIKQNFAKKVLEEENSENTADIASEYTAKIAAICTFAAILAAGFTTGLEIMDEDLETTASPHQSTVMENFEDAAQTLIAQHNKLQTTQENNSFRTTMDSINSITKADSTENNISIPADSNTNELKTNFNSGVEKFFDTLATDINISEADKAELIEILDDAGIDAEYHTGHDINPKYLNECSIGAAYKSADDIYRCSDEVANSNSTLESNFIDASLGVGLGFLISYGLLKGLISGGDALFDEKRLKRWVKGKPKY